MTRMMMIRQLLAKYGADTKPIVPLIRSRIATGESHQSIADSIGVSRPAITYLANGKTWKHVA